LREIKIGKPSLHGCEGIAITAMPSDWSPVYPTAYLVANGDAPTPGILQNINSTNVHIIAVDGGGAALAAAGIMPDCIMGDMDSLGEWAERINIPQILLPDQNKSDLEKSILYLLDRGVKNFVLYGAWGGGRLDHALANLDLLTVYAPRCRICMTIGDTMIDGLSMENTAPNGLDLSARVGTKLGLLSAGKAATLTLRGVEYPLEQVELQPGTHGVGNTTTANQIHVQIFSGCAWLVRMPENINV